jgi:hypothetical protein
MIILIGYVYTIGILARMSVEIVRTLFLTMSLALIGTIFATIGITEKSRYFSFKNNFLDIGIITIIGFLAGLFYSVWESWVFGAVCISSTLIGMFYLLLLLIIMRVKDGKN